MFCTFTFFYVTAIRWHGLYIKKEISHTGPTPRLFRWQLWTFIETGHLSVTLPVTVTTMSDMPDKATCMFDHVDLACCTLQLLRFKGARAQKIRLKNSYILKYDLGKNLSKKCDVKWLTLNKILTTYLKRWKMHVIWGKSLLCPWTRQ